MSIREVINRDYLRIVYQPLVNLEDGTVFAQEALCRCAHPAFASPVLLFERAVAQNTVGALGRHLRELAIAGCPNTPLFINIHPNEFDEHFLSQPTDPIYQHGELIYLEITESVPLHYFEQCHGVLAEARGKGIRLAVDDLGAGYSNFKYISDLAPDVVKIDRDLVTGLRRGTRLHRLVTSLVRLCVDMEAMVVVEGIETEEELDAVRSTGAHLGQGYFLARPASPAPEVYWPDKLCSAIG